MIKKIFFLAFICAVVSSCSKQTDTVQLNSNESVSSYKLSSASVKGDLPTEVRDIIINGGDGHFDCDISNNRAVLGGGSSSGGSALGTYAYPFILNMNPIKLYNSSLPCQPGIPYFIFGNVDAQGQGKNSDEISATFRLVLNPSYFDPVKVVDVNWELNGQNDPAPVSSFTINDLQIGQSNSVTCEVFSTDNYATVYSQEMTFDFEILIDPQVGSAVIEYASGYTYSCASGGTFPIIAP